MGIQIDGSANTISGLAAGGLPDGSISSDDIASNAVTVAKLASTLDLSSNTVTLPNTSVTAGMLASTLDISGKTVTLPNTSVTAGMLASTLDLSSKTVTLPSGTGGKILQVVQTVKTDTAAQAAQNTMADIPGMSVAITPSSTSSKVLVRIALGVIGTATSGRGVTFTLLRGSTAIGLGDDPGNSNEQATFATQAGDSTYMEGGVFYEFLDSPSTTSEVTYKLQWQTFSNTNIYLNRSGSTSTAEWNKSGSSTITAMEVAA